LVGHDGEILRLVMAKSLSLLYHDILKIFF